MTTIISPEQRRTIEATSCVYCKRGFYLESNIEIDKHQRIPLEEPFPTGFIYGSCQGFNLITSEGGILSDLEFGEEYTHDYIHQVATCKNPEERLTFERLLKTRTARDLKKRLQQGQIWYPTLPELGEFKKKFKDYLRHEGYNDDRKVFGALNRVGYRDLN